MGFWRWNNPVLWVAGGLTGILLYKMIFSRKGALPKRRKVRKAIRENPGTPALYEAFHGANPQHTRHVKVPIPRGPMLAIGRAVRIEYEPYGSSTLKNVRFYHDFGDLGESKIKERPILATDAEGHDLFLIPQHAKYPHFSDRGILG